MSLVYYSLACSPDGAREEQLVQSMRSLRRHNGQIRVNLFLYGTPRRETLEEAQRQGVDVIHLGEFSDCFSELPRHWGQALVQHPTLHKLLSLRHCSFDGVDQVMFVDCDTFFFDDVDKVFAQHRDCDWYAREESLSRRNAHWYNPEYLDEDLLADIARREGLVVVPPYNSGVCVMNRGVWWGLLWLVEDFLWYAWRLLLGASLWRPEAMRNAALVQFVRDHASERERALALPYPSSNGWILEQVALWLVLGRLPQLSHNLLSPSHVAQGGEFTQITGQVLVHYFSEAEHRFFAMLGRV